MYERPTIQLLIFLIILVIAGVWLLEHLPAVLEWLRQYEGS
jgi:hypothetical protein